jgi:hypothetical protein
MERVKYRAARAGEGHPRPQVKRAACSPRTHWDCYRCEQCEVLCRPKLFNLASTSHLTLVENYMTVATLEAADTIDQRPPGWTAFRKPVCFPGNDVAGPV